MHIIQQVHVCYTATSIKLFAKSLTEGALYSLSPPVVEADIFWGNPAGLESHDWNGTGKNVSGSRWDRES